MAQRVQIVLTDDLDQTEAAETVSFALDGATYEIDLSEANARGLREALATYVAAARKTGGSAKKRPQPPRRKSAGGATANEIRAWAVEQGMNVSSRGRVSAEVREAYENSHN